MAIRFRIKCPLCGMRPDLRNLVKTDIEFGIYEQELGGRLKGTGNQTEKGKRKGKPRGALGIMRYDEITDGSRIFTSSDIDYDKKTGECTNPYINEGVLSTGDDVVEKIKDILKGRLEKITTLIGEW